MRTFKNEHFEAALFERKQEKLRRRHYQHGIRHVFIDEFFTLDKVVVTFQFDDTAFSAIRSKIEMNDQYVIDEKEIQNRMFKLFSADLDDVDEDFINSLAE